MSSRISSDAIRTKSFHHTVYLFYLKTFRVRDGRGIYILDTKGLSTGSTCKVHMRIVDRAAFATAIYLRPAAIVHFVQKLMLQEQRKSTEESGFVYSPKSFLHLGKSKGMIHGYDFPHDHDTVRGRPDLCISQYLLYIFHTLQI